MEQPRGGGFSLDRGNKNAKMGIGKKKKVNTLPINVNPLEREQMQCLLLCPKWTSLSAVIPH